MTTSLPHPHRCTRMHAAVTAAHAARHRHPGLRWFTTRPGRVPGGRYIIDHTDHGPSIYVDGGLCPDAYSEALHAAIAELDTVRGGVVVPMPRRSPEYRRHRP